MCCWEASNCTGAITNDYSQPEGNQDRQVLGTGLRYYLLNPVFSSWPGPYLNGCEEITHPVRKCYVSVSETDCPC